MRANVFPLGPPLPVPLTKRELDRLEYEEGGPRHQILHDPDLAGFGVRVYPTGRKMFFVRYRTAGGRRGRERWLTLGRYGELTLHQARERARDALAAVRSGRDPVEEREAVRTGITLAEFAPLYLAQHAKRAKKSWREDERRLAKHILPALRRYRLDAITRAHVAQLHRAISETSPVEANRVLALVSVIFAKAVEWEHLPETAANPAVHVQTNRERPRDRWIKPAELPALLGAIEAEESSYIRAAFLLYLLTGLRRSELLRLQWKNVDLDRREIYLPDTKANRPHTVPLSAPAAELLAELPRQSNNPHVFPGRDRGHLSDMKRPWLRIRERSALEDVRLHDLRRTVGSWLAMSGASLPLIGKVLNHSNPSTTQIYARMTEDPARAALENHAAQILAWTAPPGPVGR